MLGILFRMLLNSPATNTAARILGQTDVANAGNLKALVLGETSASGNGDAPIIDPRIESHYRQHIKPFLDEFEANRVSALTTLRQRLMLALPALVGAILFGLMGAGTPENQFSLVKLLGTLCMIAAISAAVWAAMPVLYYKGSIKERIFRNVFTFFGPDWHYDPKGIGGGVVLNADMFAGKSPLAGYRAIASAIKDSTMDDAHRLQDTGSSSVMTPYMIYGILPGHETATTKDLLRGMQKQVPLELLQCRLISESGSGKNRHTTVHFEGLVITLDVPKRFTGHTVIKRDKGSVGNWFGKTFAGGLTPVKLEDPRFEERYEVYGTDQIEARYLLNPAFMERLVELEDLFAEHQSGNCSIQCAFKDGKLLFAIPTTKEWFATGSIFKPANFIEEINAILKEMDQLFAIIDVLKLDDRTGL